MNEVDGEEVPGVPEDFQYLEHGYDWGKYASDPNFLIGCDCVGNCNSADVEGCCIRHIDSDPEELMGFWYDKRVRSLRECDFGITSLTSMARACSVLVLPTYYSGNAM
jgi:hypothetical protein